MLGAFAWKKVLTTLLSCSVAAAATLAVPAAAGAQAVDSVGVSYSAHVQKIGWQAPVANGADAGTTGRSLRVEGIKIQLTGAPSGASIQYQAQVQKIGWQAPVANGALAGTTGKSLRIEALRITLNGLNGYEVQYRAHVQHIGWTAWQTTANGTPIATAAVAGTVGKSLRVEAVDIRIVNTKPVAVGAIAVTAAGSAVSVKVGSTLQMGATVTPANAANKTVAWSVTPGTGAATISPSGLLTGTAAGTVIVTAAAGDGSGVKGSKTVVVLAADAGSSGVVYTVSFNTQGGSAVAPITGIEAGFPVTMPAAPVKDGSVFEGWNTAADGTGAVFDATSVVNANITVYAQWFTPSTDFSTADTAAVLGVTGTSASADNNGAVATADLTTNPGRVTITSVSPGTATITVSDGTNSAAIPVTVNAFGAITVGTIRPYTGAFTSQTDKSVANDPSVLNITGTSAVSGNPSVATADLTSNTGDVTVTSVGMGSTAIEVSDGTGTAIIPVTVDATGAITIGTVVPYQPSFTQSDSSTANTVAVLGLAGTSAVSSNDAVATADLTSRPGYVTIWSAGAGTATITVFNGTEAAYLFVTVDAAGNIAIGSILPYEGAFTSETDSTIANAAADLGIQGTGVS